MPVFRKQKEGLMRNVSSVGGLAGVPSIPRYISTKFALEGFSESLSYVLASQNIVVKMVEPGGGDPAFRARAAKLNTGDGGIDSSGAVTDGTKTLRYVAGDDVKHFVEARRKLSDEDYENYMRAQFA
jgi:short-subunit dehydrogenase